MAVVNKRAAGLPDLTSAKPGRADVRKSHGVVRVSRFAAAIANGDSTGSTYEVARLPSHAVILRSSQIHCTAITNVSDADLGPAESPDCLVDGQTLVSAASVGAASAVAVTDLDKPLWQLAGLTADPAREMPIYLTLNSGATANGTAVVELHYVCD